MGFCLFRFKFFAFKILSFRFLNIWSQPNSFTLFLLVENIIHLYVCLLSRRFLHILRNSLLALVGGCFFYQSFNTTVKINRHLSSSLPLYTRRWLVIIKPLFLLKNSGPSPLHHQRLLLLLLLHRSEGVKPYFLSIFKYHSVHFIVILHN